MAKIKLTKGELKRQRDALKQYGRYLPTLQLKKQQLQIEITRQLLLLDEKTNSLAAKRKTLESWAELFADEAVNTQELFTLKNIVLDTKNIAGVNLPVFVRAEFEAADYDLFIIPPWVDAAIEALKVFIALDEEIKAIGKGIEVLRRELRITTQRVNLFEKVKIPEAEEAIRLIKIYIGDQMTNGVGRSKIAKRKIEESELQEVAA
jgi:V/A-type H+-transporting ATPase subunit D